MKDFNTDTSDWSLVIHRVTTSTAEIWVGTINSDLKMPERARIRLIEDGEELRSISISKEEWKRPFRKITKQRFYCLHRFERLVSGKAYEVAFDRYVNLEDAEGESFWQCLQEGKFKTLPDTLPTPEEGALTIGLASCFYPHRDGGRAAASFKALYERGRPADQPDVTFFSGDQVYLDIGFDSLSPVPKEIANRIANDYAKNWKMLGSIHKRGANWMLPDDHEYWNDYPNYKTLIPQLQMLRVKKIRDAWTVNAKDGVKNIQRSPVVEQFTIADKVSVCMADLRSFRDSVGFIDKPNFDNLCAWAESLTMPGILLLPQPLIVRRNKSEANLRTFDKQYRALLSALASSGHDVVLLSGDVHFGRVATVPLGTGSARLIEIVSSPLSNLTGLNGIATSKPVALPEEFPPYTTIPNWPKQKVIYSTDRNVPTHRGRLLSSYPKTRTAEHFMTVALQEVGGRVRLTAKAWMARQRVNPGYLPKQCLKKPYQTILN